MPQLLKQQQNKNSSIFKKKQKQNTEWRMIQSYQKWATVPAEWNLKRDLFL